MLLAKEPRALGLPRLDEASTEPGRARLPEPWTDDFGNVLAVVK